jgi:hypothetical protein
MGTHFFVGSESSKASLTQDVIPVNDYIYSNVDKRGKIRAMKGIEVIGRGLRYSIATIQGVIEIQAAFWYGEVAGNRQCAKKVVNGVVPKLREGYLSSCKDNSFSEILKQETEGTGSV